MKQPLTEQEKRQNQFIPPFCPNEKCVHHLPDDAWHASLAGWYQPKGSDHRLRRYYCPSCEKTFSITRFKLSCWLHRPELLVRIAEMSVACSGLRQMARILGISHNTVARYLSRIGRQCLLHHLDTIEGFEITESVAVDGFESFEYSQYFPCHFHLATGRDSWFLYYFTDSPLRRKGRMTKEQKQRRRELEAQLGRPDPKAIEKDMTELLDTIVSRMVRREKIEIHCDEHKAYPRAVQRLKRQKIDLPEIKLKTISSKAARTFRNPLFSINRADMLIRHCSANHKRETIAFSKLRQKAAERLAVLMVYLNEIKRQREKGPPRSSAMILGLRRQLATWQDILTNRLFSKHIKPIGRWAEYYRGLVKTQIFGSRQNIPNNVYVT